MQGAALPPRPQSPGFCGEYLMNLGSNDSVPLWLLYENEIDAWRAEQTPLVARWLAEQNFKGEKHRVVLLPDSAGGIAAAVGGLGKRLGELSLWHAAGLVARRPRPPVPLGPGVSAPEGPPPLLWVRYVAESLRPPPRA